MLKYPTIPCNDCKYCMPCPYGLDIPAVLLHYNRCVNEGNVARSGQDENYAKARRAFLVGYDRSVPKLRQASHCIGCNQCVAHCPQNIDIPKELHRIDQFVEQLKQAVFLLILYFVFQLSLSYFLLLIFSRKSRISGNISSADSTSLHIVSTGHPPVRSRFQIKATSCAKSTFTSDFRNSSKALVLIISVYNSSIPPRIIRAAAPFPTTDPRFSGKDQK